MSVATGEAGQILELPVSLWRTGDVVINSGVIVNRVVPIPWVGACNVIVQAEGTPYFASATLDATAVAQVFRVGAR